VVPIVIGLLLRNDRFEPALLYIGSLALLGAVSNIFIVGRIERIPQARNGRPP
jgi:ACS family D-galactonate transporter-like MFS transporter